MAFLWKKYRDFNFFLYDTILPPPPPVIHNFLLIYDLFHNLHLSYKGSCVWRGGQYCIRKSWNSFIFFQRNAMMDIRIAIIDICYAHTTPIPKLWSFLYFVNENLIKMRKLKNWPKRWGEVYALSLKVL